MTRINWKEQKEMTGGGVLLLLYSNQYLTFSRFVNIWKTRKYSRDLSDRTVSDCVFVQRLVFIDYGFFLSLFLEDNETL